MKAQAPAEHLAYNLVRSGDLAAAREQTRHLSSKALRRVGLRKKVK